MPSLLAPTQLEGNPFPDIDELLSQGYWPWPWRFSLTSRFSSGTGWDVGLAQPLRVWELAGTPARYHEAQGVWLALERTQGQKAHEVIPWVPLSRVMRSDLLPPGSWLPLLEGGLEAWGRWLSQGAILPPPAEVYGLARALLVAAECSSGLWDKEMLTLLREDPFGRLLLRLRLLLLNQPQAPAEDLLPALLSSSPG